MPYVLAKSIRTRYSDGRPYGVTTDFLQSSSPVLFSALAAFAAELEAIQEHEDSDLVMLKNELRILRHVRIRVHQDALGSP